MAKTSNLVNSVSFDQLWIIADRRGPMRHSCPDAEIKAASIGGGQVSFVNYLPRQGSVGKPQRHS